MNRKSLLIVIPDNGMGLGRTRWALSLAHACATVLRDYDLSFTHVSFPYPDGAANIALNRFLYETECDELLFIDADVIFTPGHLKMLLDADSDCVFGLYPKKAPGLEFPIVLFDGQEFPAEPGLIATRYCARGFMRVTRRCVQAVAKLVPIGLCPISQKDMHCFYINHAVGHGDDFNFCDRVREAGFTVHLDTRITCQHEGDAVYPIPGTFTNHKQTKAA
jgi:hypothetical protein